MRTDRQFDGSGWPTTRVTLLRHVADRRDVAAWDRFVRLYGPLIHRYCRRRGLQDADALDVTQDVLLQLSRQMGDFRYDRRLGRFRNWLGTITHRALLKRVARSQSRSSGSRASRFPRPLAQHACRDSLGASWVEAFNAHVYRTAVERVRPLFDRETWEAFRATFVEHRPPREVAVELERTVGWVYQAKFHVVRRLKEEILYLAEDSAMFNLPNSDFSPR